MGMGDTDTKNSCKAGCEEGGVEVIHSNAKSNIPSI